MSVNNRPNVAYCLNQPLGNIFPAPIVSARAPLSTDKAPIGTLWIQPSTNSSWVLTSIVSNSATWSSSSGGTGDFTNLTVTTSATIGTYSGSVGSGTGASIIVDPTGTFQVEVLAQGTIIIDSNADVSILSSAAGSSAILLGTTIGEIHLDSGSDIFLDTISSNGAITLQSGTGAINVGTDAAAKTVTVGNVTGATAVNINGGTGGINLAAAGIVTMTTTTPTAASPTASVTSNANVISATFTGFTTASAASQAFTITSSKITTSTPVIVTVSNLNASTNGALMGITGITQASGSIVVSTKNNGAAALGTGDTVFVNVWVL